MTGFLAIVAAILGAVGLFWLLHLCRLKRHEGLGREDFIEHFKVSGVSASVSGAVYDQFQRLGFWSTFRPSPADSLRGTFRTVDEDLEDTLKDILGRLALDLPTVQFCKGGMSRLKPFPMLFIGSNG